jgi:proteasomal ATPase-associated factor 1
MAILILLQLQVNSTSICFDSGMHLFVGTEKGSINVYDLRTKKQQMVIETQRGKCNRLLHQGVLGLVAAFNDGSVASYNDETLFTTALPTIEFTGSDCDPIYDMSTNNSSLFTACRDSVIRKYSYE